MTRGRSSGGRFAALAAGLCGLALATGLSLPPAAAAGKGTFEGSFFGETGTQIEFSLGKAPGRKLTVSTSGKKVRLTVDRGFQSVSYEAAGSVSEHGLRADLGRAGLIDVTFDPSKPPESVEPFPFCNGKDGTVTAGTFVGTIRFTGFDRFVDFRATRARGEVSKEPPRRCHFPGGSHKHHPRTEGDEEDEGSAAVLVAGPPCGGLAFIAAGDADPFTHFTIFAAISSDHVGRVRISRFVFLIVQRQDGFTFDPTLTSATVEPPPPFHGVGEFRRGTDGAPSSWTGPLRIAFLDGTVALTGGRIEANLVDEADSESAGFVFSSKCEGHASAGTIPLPLP